MPLIRDRRTVARVYAASDGPMVPHVTAYLYRINPLTGAVMGDPLAPSNYPSTHITVNDDGLFDLRPNPERSLQFELPWSWVDGTLPLRLKAVLNPYNLPLETSLANNTASTGVLALNPSSRLNIKVWAISYEVDGKYYVLGEQDDLQTTWSYIRRSFPVASKPGTGYSESGFQPDVYHVFLNGLGTRVNQTAPECLEMDEKDRNKCASEYVHAKLEEWRQQNSGEETFYYGMIPQGPKFVRGFARDGNATGPAGPPSGGSAWDTDSTMGDWYAAHEIAHTLGRRHPFPGSQDDSGVCGQKGEDGDLDGNFPYPDGHIGAPNDSNTGVVGFDVGDPALALPQRVYMPGVWYDFMSYCDFQWISDYTYLGMYVSMGLDAVSGTSALSDVSISGDGLRVSGTILPEQGKAYLSQLRRVSELKMPSLHTSGPYVLEQLDAEGTLLSSHAFTPVETHDHDSSRYSFQLAVPFAAGVRSVRIADGNQTVLLRRAVSANSPVVSGVAIQGASHPLSGTVTLSWQAHDPDGDQLAFDVLASSNGRSFAPLQLDLSGSSTSIDTALLGGGLTRFRVIASDGVQRSTADSPVYQVSAKAPEPRILSLGNGTRVHHGQLLNVHGSAADLQDGSIGESGLIWRNAAGKLLHTGAAFSSSALPVGSNMITLTATNSAGLSASTSITIVVDDDLELPGPTLTVGPDQLGWHVADSTAGVQTATIDLFNAGDGSLSWTASSSVAWLSISATSGSAPANLTVSTNPAGLADGTALQAVVTITANGGAGQPPQVVIIPVTLTVGDSRETVDSGDIPGRHSIYVPLLSR